MDNLTHTLIGVAVARAGLAKRYGRGTTWILAVASNLPDLDIFVGFFGGTDAFLYRRMLTHSIFGIPIIALAASWIFGWFFKQIPFKDIFGLTVFAMGLHVVFDWMNSYGVVPFYPLSRMRVELAWLFIIDLAIWAILILPLMIERIPAIGMVPQRKDRLWRVAVSVLTLYVGLCGLAHSRARHLLESVQGPDPVIQEPYVFPEALGFHRFRGVISVPPSLRLYRIHVFTGQTELFQTYETVQADPRLVPLLQTERLRRLLWFFKRPVFQWTSPGHVRVFDLRFVSTVLPMRGSVFSFEFEVPPQLVSWLVSPYTPST